jgi:hypothetical protein
MIPQQAAARKEKTEKLLLCTYAGDCTLHLQYSHKLRLNKLEYS